MNLIIGSTTSLAAFFCVHQLYNFFFISGINPFYPILRMDYFYIQLVLLIDIVPSPALSSCSGLTLGLQCLWLTTFLTSVMVEIIDITFYSCSCKLYQLPSLNYTYSISQETQPCDPTRSLRNLQFLTTLLRCSTLHQWRIRGGGGSPKGDDPLEM